MTRATRRHFRKDHCRYGCLKAIVGDRTLCEECQLCVLPDDEFGKAQGCCNCNVCQHRDCGARQESGLCDNCGECSDHCECDVCDCGQRGRPGSFCRECSSCPSCCSHVRCGGCQAVVEGSDCDRCERCPDCWCRHRDPDSVFVNNPLKFWTPTWMQNRGGGSKRHVSAEIEVGGADKSGYRDIKAVVTKWSGSIVPDGSLPGGGFEINTAPAGGDLFVKQIEEIGAELREADAHVTDECGLHVHIDARDFRYYDVLRLMRVYARIEPALFEMVPYERRINQYCQPTAEKILKALEGGVKPDKRSKAVKSAVFRGMYESDKKDILQGTRKRKYPLHGGRYWALNLHSWMHRGSIECRLFNGTVDPQEIILWGTMWAHLLDWVAGHTDAEADRLLAKNTKARSALLAMLAGHTKVIKFVKARWKSEVFVDEEGP